MDPNVVSTDRDVAPSNRRPIIDRTTGSRRSGVDVLNNAEPAAMDAYLTAWAHSDIPAEIAENPMPVQVLVGERGPAASAAVMRETFSRWDPHRAVETMAGSGHDAIEKTLLALAATSENFLAEA